MTTHEKLLKRIDELVILADNVLKTERRGSGNFSSSYVDHEPFTEFKTSSLSFILNLYGDKHPYYRGFEDGCRRATPFESKAGRAILSSITTEIEQGWLSSLRGLVSSEIFVDFLEMAEHLLSEGYKDAAAVMIGSVLEEHIRQLSNSEGIPITNAKDGKPVPKKADTLNSELAKAGVYNLLDQKNVTAWLDLRNKAAHGKYDEYTKEQVVLMSQAITDFMTRNSI